MDVASIKKIPHLSSSAISDFLSCGIMYRLARIEKLPREFIPDALEFGSAIHRALADFWLAKKAGHYMPITELQQKFESYWTEAAKDNNEIKYKEDKDFETLLKEGKELLSVYVSSIPDTNFKVLAVEEPIVFELPGVIIPIIGIVDLVEEDSDGTVVITDHKTAGKSYPFDDVNSNIQMTLYGMGMKQNGYADREILMKFDTLIKTKIPKFEQYYTSRNSEDEVKLIKKVQLACHGITSQVFLPTQETWRCKGCQFSLACNAYLLS